MPFWQQSHQKYSKVQRDEGDKEIPKNKTAVILGRMVLGGLAITPSIHLLHPLHPCEFFSPLKRGRHSVEEPLEVFALGEADKDWMVGTLPKGLQLAGRPACIAESLGHATAEFFSRDMM